MTARYRVWPDLSTVVLVGGLALITVYFAALAWAADTWDYERWAAVVLAPVLFAVGAAIIVAVTRRDAVPLTGLIVAALLLKLVASFARYIVAFELYATGDAVRYNRVGTEISDAFHSGQLSLGELLSVGRGTTFMEDVTGIIYTSLGPSELVGFLIYSWTGFWGLFLFHRAALIGFPEADQRRYAFLVFFMPSLLFWPSSIGKESVMMLSLGLCAYGSARLLERLPGGWVVLGAGLGLGYVVRPHVPVVVLAALAVAILFRPRSSRTPVFGPLGRIVTVLVLIVGLAFAMSEAVDRFLPLSRVETSSEVGLEAVGELLDVAAIGTSELGEEVDRPSANNPLEYPEAVFTVLFRPTILEASSAGNAVASLETTFILVLAVIGWKRLRNVPKMIFRRPYLLMCVVYTGIFTFAWSSFANLGALARQRVQVWPFVLLLLAVPAVLTWKPERGTGAGRRSKPDRSTRGRDGLHAGGPDTSTSVRPRRATDRQL